MVNKIVLWVSQADQAVQVFNSMRDLNLDVAF